MLREENEEIERVPCDTLNCTACVCWGEGGGGGRRQRTAHTTWRSIFLASTEQGLDAECSSLSGPESRCWVAAGGMGNGGAFSKSLLDNSSSRRRSESPRGASLRLNTHFPPRLFHRQTRLFGPPNRVENKDGKEGGRVNAHALEGKFPHNEPHVANSVRARRWLPASLALRPG